MVIFLGSPIAATVFCGQLAVSCHALTGLLDGLTGQVRPHRTVFFACAPSRYSGLNFPPAPSATFGAAGCPVSRRWCRRIVARMSPTVCSWASPGLPRPGGCMEVQRAFGLVDAEADGVQDGVCLAASRVAITNDLSTHHCKYKWLLVLCWRC